MKKVIVIIVLLYLATPVNAVIYHFYDGNELLDGALEWEKSQASPKDADLLLVAGYAGYVGAMFDHLSVSQAICTPDEMTKNEVLKVVADHVKTKNRGLKYSASTIIEEALVESYRCKRT